MQNTNTTMGANPPMMNQGATQMPSMTPPPMQPMGNMGGMNNMGGMQGQSSFADGGETSSSKKNPLKDFFSDINYVEAGIMALGVAAFIYAIYYYKFEMTMTKTGYADLNGRLQRIEVEESKRKTAEANASGGKMKKKRILI